LIDFTGAVEQDAACKHLCHDAAGAPYVDGGSVNFSSK
jgi:hypothetical protein